MSFGGAVAAMITSLKNNSRRHKRKSAFEGRGNSTENVKLSFIGKGKMTEKELEKLGVKLRKQDNKRLLHNLLITLLIVVVFIVAFTTLVLTVQ